MKISHGRHHSSEQVTSLSFTCLPSDPIVFPMNLALLPCLRCNKAPAQTPGTNRDAHQKRVLLLYLPYFPLVSTQCAERLLPRWG